MDLEVGQIVDGYRITGVLGRGGMGVVYKAEDTALSRDVALKVILANLTRDDQFIRRFQTEARTLAQVDSPYIVRVHALRETEAGWFIVMEYVEGGTVADLLEDAEHGIDVDDAMPIIRQMFQAFEHAHGAGIIHRDIKPENVMLTKSRRVKIADFGLAKQNSPDTLATVTQGMMGTLYYMSPEQVRGLGEVDHRSDLWALGVVMYEMLTGRRPFKATYEAAVLYAILNEEPLPITAADGDIPRGMQDIIFRLLEKDQDARFQTAGEVLGALDALGGAAKRAETPPARTAAAGADAPTVTAPGGPAAADRSPDRAPGAEKTAGEESIIRRIRERVSLKRFAQGFTLVLAVTAAVINFYGLISSRSDASSNDRYLYISTSPADAMVTVGGIDIGSSPIDGYPVSGGDSEKSVQIRKDGYAEIDTVLGIGVRHAFTLSPMTDGPAAGGDAVTSDDGTGSGADAEPVDPDDGAPNDTPVTTPPRRGSLTINVQPDGDAYVDGDPIETGTSFSLAAGRHDIRITHDFYGELTHTIDVPAGGSTDVTCHLVGDVNVFTNPWATILIDGEATEHQTPTVLQLPPGTYDIGVRKDGWTAEQSEGPDTVTIQGSCDGRESTRLVFQLTRQ